MPEPGSEGTAREGDRLERLLIPLPPESAGDPQTAWRPLPQETFSEWLFSRETEAQGEGAPQFWTWGCLSVP